MSALVQVMGVQAFKESKSPGKSATMPVTDSAQAWLRLVATVLLSTIGGGQFAGWCLEASEVVCDARISSSPISCSLM
jgi:hypothetical protein